MVAAQRCVLVGPEKLFASATWTPLMSVRGQSLPRYPAAGPPDVRYASKSDQNVAAPRMVAMCAKRRHSTVRPLSRRRALRRLSNSATLHVNDGNGHGGGTWQATARSANFTWQERTAGIGRREFITLVCRATAMRPLSAHALNWRFT
jgi:hypothetical protein